MSLWMLIVLIGLIKLPVAALMLWLPFRRDSAAIVEADSASESSDEDGGSKVAAPSSGDPHPRLPNLPPRPRGPHGESSPPSPERVRTPPGKLVRRRRVTR